MTDTPSDNAPHLLVVDDDRRIRSLLGTFLKNEGFRVTTADCAASAREKLRGLAFDLIVLDVMMPGENGVELARDLRKTDPVPILMLTARAETEHRIVGLESGADDYLPKPFEPRELVARIQSVLRRFQEPASSDVIQFGDLSINAATYEVRIKDVLVELTSAEYELLNLFASNPGKVLDRDQIMEQVRGIEWESFNRSVDVLVSRLRQKLKDDPKHPQYLKTIWGTGYLFIAKRT